MSPTRSSGLAIDLDGINVLDLQIPGLVEPSDVAVDPVGAKVYWCDVQTRKIQRANLDGSNVETVFTGNARGIALLPTAGACCLPDGGCEIKSAADCFAAHGQFGGVDASCGAVSCPQPCPGDLDDDGVVGIVDFLGLLSNWGACP